MEKLSNKVNDYAIYSSVGHHITPPPVAYDTYDERCLGKWTRRPEQVVCVWSNDGGFGIGCK